jgi:hypothetical protein
MLIPMYDTAHVMVTVLNLWNRHLTGSRSAPFLKACYIDVLCEAGSLDGQDHDYNKNITRSTPATDSSILYKPGRQSMNSNLLYDTNYKAVAACIAVQCLVYHQRAS